MKSGMKSVQQGGAVMSNLSKLALNMDGFAFDPTSGDSYVLNPTALVVTQGLRDGRTSDQIARQLTAEYEVSEEAASRDIADFLVRLKSLRLV